MSALPFGAPQESHAQTTPASSNPVCEFELNTNIPGQFCVPKNIDIKPGDSNATIELNKRLDMARHTREAQLAFNRAKNITPKPLTPVSLTLGGFSTTTVLYADPGQCVPFARAVSGLPVFGTARNVPITSTEPQKGAVVLTKESPAGHAAYVKDVQGDTLVLLERNFERGLVTMRTLSKFSPVIRGYVTGS